MLIELDMCSLYFDGLLMASKESREGMDVLCVYSGWVSEGANPLLSNKNHACPSRSWETIFLCKSCCSWYSTEKIDWVVRRLVALGKSTLHITVHLNFRSWKSCLKTGFMNQHLAGTLFLIRIMVPPLGKSKLAPWDPASMHQLESSPGKHGAASQPAWWCGCMKSKNIFLHPGQDGVSTALCLSSQGAPPNTFWLCTRGVVHRSQDREALRKGCGQNCRNQI